MLLDFVNQMEEITWLALFGVVVEVYQIRYPLRWVWKQNEC